jgi:hypothetical protein
MRFVAGAAVEAVDIKLSKILAELNRWRSAHGNKAHEMLPCRFATPP